MRYPLFALCFLKGIQAYAADAAPTASKVCGASDPAATMVLKTLVLCGPLLLAVVVAIVSAWLVRDKLGQRMGSPQWSFGSSWATNVTLGGGVLAMVLSYAMFPASPHFLSKASYLATGVAFSVLAAIAPQAYNLFRKPVDDPADPAGMQLQGFVAAFVVAAALTSWGAMGQAAATALAVGELRCTGDLDACLAWPLIALLILLAFGVAVYVVCTVNFIVRHQLDRKTPLTAARADGTLLPFPNWYLL